MASTVAGRGGPPGIRFNGANSRTRPIWDGDLSMAVAGGPANQVVTVDLGGAVNPDLIHRRAHRAAQLPAHRRGRLLTIPGATVAPVAATWVPHIERHAVQLPAVRRGRRTFVPGATVAPVTATFVPHIEHRATTIPAVRRGRRTFVIPVPRSPSPITIHNRTRGVLPAIRRGKRPAPASLTPPTSPATRARNHRAPLTPIRRGRGPIPTPVPPPPPPKFPPGNLRGKAAHILRRVRNVLARFIFPGVAPVLPEPGCVHGTITIPGVAFAVTLPGATSAITTPTVVFTITNC